MSLGWKKRYTKLMENANVSTYDRPFLSMVSNEEIRVENHKGIVEFNSDSIIISTLNYFIKISGENLSLESMTREDVNVMGKIKTVDFEPI